MYEFQTGQPCGLSDILEVGVQSAFELRELVLQHIIGFDQSFMRPWDISFPFDVLVELGQMLTYRR